MKPSDVHLLRMCLVACLLLAANHICKAAEQDQIEITKVESLYPRVERASFTSLVLRKNKSFCVVLPEAFAQDASNKHDWPVLFLLHGRGRHERSLLEIKETRQAFLDAPFVTVFPQGDDGWYVDSPVRQGDRYESYLAEVLAVATAKYRLSPQREHRAIAGWSMGGFGAVHYAETHADEFSAVASIIGLLDFPRSGLPKGQSYDVPLDRFGQDETTWREFNPLHQAERLKQTNMLLITGDAAFDRTMNENFAARLEVLKIPAQWRMLDGGHTLDVVKTSVPLVIEFVGDHFAQENKP